MARVSILSPTSFNDSVTDVVVDSVAIAGFRVSSTGVTSPGGAEFGIVFDGGLVDWSVSGVESLKKVVTVGSVNPSDCTAG